jgi:integrase
MSYVDAAGQRHQPTAYFDSKKEARAWLHEQHDKHNKGQLADSGRRTAGQWFDEWLTIKKAQVEGNTLAYHAQNVQLYLSPHLARTPLAKLRPPHVAAMYSALEEQGISAATRKHAGITLSAALNDAVKMGLLPSNPAKAIKKPEAAKPEIHPLDPEKVAVFLAAAALDRLHALYVLAIDSGMRQGELYGLLWDAVDFDAGTVSVLRSLEEKSGKHRLEDVKTATSRRRIRLSPATLAALNLHRQKQLAKGHYREDGPVFCDTEGGWLRKPNVYNHSFVKALKLAGLSGVRFHDLRHTCATLLLLRGVNVKAVSVRLGHASIKTTLDNYSHVLPEMDEQAASTMDALLKTGTEG